MKALKDLIKDTSIYGISGVLSQLVSFLLLPLYTTYLSPADYGVLAILGYISIFFIPLASLGVTNAIFRRYNLKVEAREQTEVLSTGFWFILSSSVVLFLLGWFFAGPLSYLILNNSFTALFRLALVVSLMASLNGLVITTLRAQRRVKEIATVRVIKLVLAIGLTITLVVGFKMGIWGVLYGQLLGEFISFLLLGIKILPSISSSFNKQELKGMISYGLPFLPHRLFSRASNFAGIFLINKFIGIEEAGLYDIAVKFTIPITFIVGSIQSSWEPLKFQIHREEAEPAYTLRRIISFYFLLVFFLCAGVILTGPEILRLMTNAEFHGAAILLPFVALLPFVRGMYFMFGTGFEFTNNTRPLPLVSAIGLAGLLVTTFVFTQVLDLGIIGVIVGMLASPICMALVIRHLSKSRFYVPINNYLITSFGIALSLLAFISSVVQPVDIIFRIIYTALGLIALFVTVLIVFSKEKDYQLESLRKWAIFNKVDNWTKSLKLGSIKWLKN